MEFLMFTTIRKQFKIFGSIIIFNFINMVNNFFGKKISPKFLFQNKPVISYVSFAFGKRMFRFMNKNVTLAFLFSSFPIRMFYSRKTRRIFLNFSFMFFRKLYSETVSLFSFSAFLVTFRIAIFPPSCFNPPKRHYDFFSASKASSNCRHNCLQIKKALFGVLTKIRKIFHLLRAFGYRHKNRTSVNEYNYIICVN